MRGFRMTFAHAGTFSPAYDIAAVLDAADAPRTHVVGASCGGAVALSFAAEHPDRIASLTPWHQTCRTLTGRRRSSASQLPKRPRWPPGTSKQPPS